jgi:hypothetical protein
MVQAEVPLPVEVVLEVVPVNAVILDASAVAYPRRVVTLVISVDTLARIAITLPVTGAVREVNVVVV